MAGACDTSAMRIGIISDTHGLLRPEACARLAARAGSSCRSRWRRWLAGDALRPRLHELSTVLSL